MQGQDRAAQGPILKRIQPADGSLATHPAQGEERLSITALEGCGWGRSGVGLVILSKSFLHQRSSKPFPPLQIWARLQCFPTSRVTITIKSASSSQTYAPWNNHPPARTPITKTEQLHTAQLGVYSYGKQGFLTIKQDGSYENYVPGRAAWHRVGKSF